MVFLLIPNFFAAVVTFPFDVFNADSIAWISISDKEAASFGGASESVCANWFGSISDVINASGCRTRSLRIEFSSSLTLPGQS